MKVRKQWEQVRSIVTFALDEQHRQSQPEIAVEHVCLALFSTGGPVSIALRATGVTLDDARSAVEKVHAERLQALGVEAPAVPDAPPREPARKGPESRLSDRVTRIIADAYEDGESPEVRIWRHLQTDDLVVEALAACGVNAHDIQPDAGGDVVEPTPAPRTEDSSWATVHGIVPAPPEKVWELVANPERWLEWNSAEHSEAHREGDALRVSQRSKRADSRLDTYYRVTDLVPGKQIQWERTSEITPYSWEHRIRLDAVDGGTDVTLSYRTIYPGSAKGGMMKRVFGGMVRAGTRSTLRQKLDHITRAVRQ